MLSEQAKVVSEKIATLSEVLGNIEKLRAETLQMQTVDFRKYADIVVNLQMKNEFYGFLKHFDGDSPNRFQGFKSFQNGVPLNRTKKQLGYAILENQSQRRNQKTLLFLCRITAVFRFD